MFELRDPFDMFVGVVQVIVARVSESLVPQQTFRILVKCENGGMVVKIFASRRRVWIIIETRNGGCDGRDSKWRMVDNRDSKSFRG